MLDERRYAEATEKATEVPSSAGDRLDLAVHHLYVTIGELEKAISPILSQEYPIAEVTSIDDDPGSLLHATASRLEAHASWLRGIIGRVEL